MGFVIVEEGLRRLRQRSGGDEMVIWFQVVAKGLHTDDGGMIGGEWGIMR